jgi:sensor histidine kinase YesM
MIFNNRTQDYLPIERTKYYWIGVSGIVFLGSILAISIRFQWISISLITLIIGVVFVFGWSFFPYILSIGKILRSIVKEIQEKRELKQLIKQDKEEEETRKNEKK